MTQPPAFDARRFKTLERKGFNRIAAAYADGAHLRAELGHALLDAAGLQPGQSVLEVGCVLRLEFDRFAGARVREPETHRVQPLSFEAESFAERGIGAIHRVADARMPLRRHVHTNLVRAAGFEFDLEQ